MARLSLEGTSKENTLSALHRIGQVIRGFDNSLTELNEVETMLAHETTGPDISSDEEGPDLNFAVSMLKEMVESLIADINSALELEEVLLAIQDATEATDHPPPEDLLIPKQSASIIATRNPRVSKAICISGSESTEREGPFSIGPGVCRHSCMYHAEVMDPWLWSRFPEHLLSLVFARLPLPQVFAIPWLSKTWQSTSKTSSFRQVCAEAHPKLFGVLGHNQYLEEFWVAAFDIKAHKWYYRDLKGLPWVYRMESMYTHDGGLVCFVPAYKSDKEVLPILVCNPMTDDWRTLPLVDLSRKRPILVQLVMDAEASGCYKVMLVYMDRIGGLLARCDCYDSETGLWSPMDSGIVYGAGDVTNEGSGDNAPWVFDCASGTLLDLKDHPSLQEEIVEGYANVRDRIFVLCECESESESESEFVDPRPLTYEVSEFVWQSSASELVKLKSYKGTLEEVPSGYALMLCASDDFILLVAFNNEAMEGIYQNRHQVLRIYDIIAEEWRSLPVLNNYYTYEMLRDSFMCKLRWDAVP